MTKREAAIVTAHTGTLIGTFGDMQDYAETLLNRSIPMHEFAITKIVNKIKEKSKKDFCNISVK